MAARHGTRLWPCYASLSRPLTLMGVERTGFILSATLGLAMWNALNSILTGAAVFLLLYAAGWIAWRRDPNMLAILKASTRFRARYDPGKWAEAPWTLRLR